VSGLSFGVCVLQYNVMVTAGANQALTSIMLTLLDPPDKAVLFRPYYFNALMALQMTG
jgi:aspartate/methionine/tyrosine aminotransferase